MAFWDRKKNKPGVVTATAVAEERLPAQPVAQGQNSLSIFEKALALPEVSPEMIRTLADLRKDELNRLGRERLDAAMARIKMKVSESPPVKTKTAVGAFSYMYAPIEEYQKVVDPICGAEGVSYRFSEEPYDDKRTKVTMTIAGFGAEILVSRVADNYVPTTGKSGEPIMNDMQASGAWSSYQCRYLMKQGFGISADDDTDGVTNEEAKKQKTAPRHPPAQKGSKIDYSAMNEVQDEICKRNGYNDRWSIGKDNRAKWVNVAKQTYEGGSIYMLPKPELEKVMSAAWAAAGLKPKEGQKQTLQGEDPALAVPTPPREDPFETVPPKEVAVKDEPSKAEAKTSEKSWKILKENLQTVATANNFSLEDMSPDDKKQWLMLAVTVSGEVDGGEAVHNYDELAAILPSLRMSAIILAAERLEIISPEQSYDARDEPGG